jgi:DNA-binding IscR family transcriptional regulator
MVDVIEAAEAALSPRRCLIRGGPCRWDEVCAVHPTWVEASAAIRSVLE